MHLLEKGYYKLVKPIKTHYLHNLYLKGHVRYIQVYRERMDRQVKLAPQDSRWRPGTPRWSRIGETQFRFLIQHGLRPEHTLLDIGCWTLRGGIRFIRYLHPGNYTGIDISPEAIKVARRLVVEEGLNDLRPRLLLTSDSRFKEFSGETFDFLFAYSVFCHLPPEEIEEIFRNIGEIMGESSVFFFTFKPSGRMKKDKSKDKKFNFRYPFRYFQELARAQGFNIELLEPPSAHNYPEKKRMAKVTQGKSSTGEQRG